MSITASRKISMVNKDWVVSRKSVINGWWRQKQKTFYRVTLVYFVPLYQFQSLTHILISLLSIKCASNKDDWVQGIGTGWSTNVPNFDPRQLVQLIRSMLQDEEITDAQLVGGVNFGQLIGCFRNRFAEDSRNWQINKFKQQKSAIEGVMNELGKAANVRLKTIKKRQYHKVYFWVFPSEKNKI